MAEDGKKEQGAQYAGGDLSDRLVPDPTNPDVRKVSGFLLGKSAREDYWRLYLNRDLNYYLEFAKKDTVHAEQLPSAETIVWVKPQTRIQVVRSGSVPVEFLRGNVIQQQLGMTSDVGAIRRAMGITANAAGCTGAHCSAACSNEATCPQHPGTGGNTVDFTCGC